MRLNHLIARLDQQLQSVDGRILIALAGVPGSGKSTLVAQLSAAFNATHDKPMVALGMDGFHLPKASLRAMPNSEEAFARRGATWTFDAEALAQRLQLLRDSYQKQAVTWPAFEHEIGDPVEEAQTIEPHTRLILVEGLYLLHQADDWENVSRLFDERWFLDTPFDLSMQRLTRRHMAAWNMTQSEAEQRIASNDRLNAELVQSTRAFSDFIINEENLSA